jgi:hypothetical protein
MKISELGSGEKRHASIKDTGDFDPANIEVYVHGVGVYSLNTLKNRLKQRLSDFADMIDSSPDQLERILNDKSMDAFMSMLRGYNEVLSDLATPQMKRKRSLTLKRSRTESVDTFITALRHIKEGVPFTKSILRYGSKSYSEAVNIGREIHKAGLIENMDWERIDSPAVGDYFDVELSESEMLSTWVESIAADGVVLHADDELFNAITEAEYQGRDVPLGKPMQGDVKKFKVYVKNPKGNVVKVNFGDPNMRIKKSNPARRRSFRARHNCDNPGPRTKARYWSCRKW